MRVRQFASVGLLLSCAAGGTLVQPPDQVPFLPEQFNVSDVKFATAADGKTSLAAARSLRGCSEKCVKSAALLTGFPTAWCGSTRQPS